MKLKCIHEIIEEVALRDPLATAILSKEKVLNFHQINNCANQIANLLLNEGLTPQMRVGILLKKSPEFVISILAVLKANGTYLPLDVNYPDDRLQYFLKDSQISLLITTDEFLDRFPNVRNVTINNYHYDNQPVTNQVNTIATLEELAYIIYTSGTTGYPKGVVIRHRSISGYANALGTVIDLKANDRYLHTASFSFSASVRQLMLPLSRGATVYLATHEEILNPIKLLNLIRKQKITILDTFPSNLRNLLKSLSFLDIEKRKQLTNNSLRVVLTTSEALTYNIPFSWRKEFGQQIRFLNMYGQTETCGINTIYEVPVTSHNTSKVVPVGKAYGHGSIQILDSDLNPVQQGVPGELYISGNSVAKEYINAPQLTVDKFLNNLGNNSAIAYRTGDLGILQPDGNILLLGRCDQQIKVRGYRLMPSEIEQWLYSHPSIQEAKVKVSTGKRGECSITAYVIISNENITKEELREYLSEKIPAYMIPSIVILKKMPLLPNGKVDYERLTTLPAKKTHLACSKTKLQDEILSIWKKLLNTEDIGIDDDFFQCGGDSLIAASMFYQIENLTDKQIPLALLFTNSTVRTIAHFLEDSNKENWNSLVPIRPSGNQLPLYCVHGIGGNVINYKTLAKHLKINRPLYGLQAQGLDGLTAPFYTIEEMAAHYVSEIKKLQPKGPYYLSGYSFGGWIALEMARQLTENFENVALLVLLDTRRNFESRAALKDQNFSTLLKKRTVYQLNNLLNTNNKLEYSLSRLRTIYRRIRNKYLYFRWNKYSEMNEKIADNGELPVSLQRVTVACWAALRNYVPCRIRGRITLIHTRRVHPLYNTPEEEWGRFADELDVHYISGTHNTILDEPYVQELANTLNNLLD